jgi:hypothetical protein
MQSREVFKNAPVDSTLNGAINDSTTTVVVDDGSVFPSTGNFRVLVDTEIMHVTARTGTTLTVNRGIEGTTAASHSSGATVSHIMTAGNLLRTGQDNVPLWGSTSRPPFGIYDGGIIDSSDFTVVNQNSTVITDDFGCIALDKPPNSLSNQNCTLLVRPATIPFTITMAMQFRCVVGNIADNIMAGLIVGDSGTDEFITFGVDDIVSSSRVQRRIAAWRYTDATTYSGAASQSALDMTFADVVWLRIVANGSNLIYSLSQDGISWQQIKSELDDAFLSAIDQVGFQINSRSNNYHALMRVLHWGIE